ncbi:hypothetical protein WBP06_08440 [Novosphingobium sp. BL-8H]|uniref:hypothetical protein n=1 Tax=Novosphingobium sp. BL-8H TaxID=3127640 RepID=UPI0037568916
MKVADEKIIRFERRTDSGGGMVIPAPAMALGSRMQDGNREEHDARSLIIAVAMCVACWVVLGYYLLT